MFEDVRKRENDTSNLKAMASNRIAMANRMRPFSHKLFWLSFPKILGTKSSVRALFQGSSPEAFWLTASCLTPSRKGRGVATGPCGQGYTSKDLIFTWIRIADGDG